MTAKTLAIGNAFTAWGPSVCLALALAGCGGSAIGGKPEIERYIYYDDGVVCYVATGYGPRNYEVSISCVKTKEAP